MEFEIPEDFAALSDDELTEALSGAATAFDARSQSSTVTATDLESLRSLATCVDSIRTEQAARQAAAEQAAAEIDTLAAQVRGGEAVTEPVEAAADTTTAAVEAEPEPAPVAPVAPVTAAAVQRPTLNLSGVRRRQPRVLPEAPAAGTQITAAVDVPGYAPGQTLDFGSITAGIISRANALKTAGGGVGQVISYRHPYPEDMIVTDSSSAPEGTLQLGRGEEVNLGVVHDSVKFSTNDYTALFVEECIALIDRSVDTRLVTVPVCPTGATGAQTILTCPVA
jgi:hypothetical protein